MGGGVKGRPDDRPRPEDLITLEEAAKLSGLSASHLRRLSRQGEILAMKVGRDWLTTEQAVREYTAREHKPGPSLLKKEPDSKYRA